MRLHVLQQISSEGLASIAGSLDAQGALGLRPSGGS